MAKETVYLASKPRYEILDGLQYTVIGGWSLTGQQLYVGFTRLLYPFLCGLLISRILPSHRSESNPSGSPIHLRGGFWWCSLALVVLFSIPCIGGKTGVPDGIFQAVCILLVFPIIVLAGAGSVTTGVGKYETPSIMYVWDLVGKTMEVVDLTRCTAGELEDISRYNGRFILQGQDGLFILKSLK